MGFDLGFIRNALVLNPKGVKSKAGGGTRTLWRQSGGEMLEVGAEAAEAQVGRSIWSLDTPRKKGQWDLG